MYFTVRTFHTVLQWTLFLQYIKKPGGCKAGGFHWLYVYTTHVAWQTKRILLMSISVQYITGVSCVFTDISMHTKCKQEYMCTTNFASFTCVKCTVTCVRLKLSCTKLENSGILSLSNT